MRIGVPKEVKNNEFRVAMTPNIAHELYSHGHKVFIEKDAGLGSGFSNQEYLDAGSTVLESAVDIFHQANLILKVKEPQAWERSQLTADHILFTYLHLAPDLQQTSDLLDSKATCIAYETVSDAAGHLPLLTPMSEIAGRMSIQAGAHCLEKSQGGRGVLLSGAPGVEPARVLILGGGVVGRNAAKIAVGMGSDVTVFDKSIETLRTLESEFGNSIKTLYASRAALLKLLPHCDLVIGAVLIPGATAPKLITKTDLSQMKSGSVIVDVAIDQGGCIETSKPTTHEKPVFTINNVVHYCVANMPGAVARSSTLALTNATAPYVIELANRGCRKALEANPGFMKGLNIVNGELCNKNVAEAQNLKSISLEDALNEL